MSSDHSESIGKARLAHSILHNCIKDKYTHIADIFEWATPVEKNRFWGWKLDFSICALWSAAGKGLNSQLSFVVSYCKFVIFPLVSWVRWGT